MVVKEPLAGGVESQADTGNQRGPPHLASNRHLVCVVREVRLMVKFATAPQTPPRRLLGTGATWSSSTALTVPTP